MAAKKHQTDVRYCVKNNAVTAHDNNINAPKICIRLMLEINSGGMVATR